MSSFNLKNWRSFKLSQIFDSFPFFVFCFVLFLWIYLSYTMTHLFTQKMNLLINWLIDWLIDWIEFYAVLAIFQPCNGGKTGLTLHRRLNNNLYLTCTCTLYMKDASSSCDVTNTFRITVFQHLCIKYHLIWYTSYLLYRCLKIYKNHCISHYDAAINHN